jgi:hypothetical protein
LGYFYFTTSHSNKIQHYILRQQMSLSDNKSALFSKSGGKAAGGPAAVSKTSGVAATSTTSASMLAARAKKKKEADEYVGKGNEYMKTSMFQWKPDHVAAATMYERATELYKQADDLPSALDTVLKAAKCHEGYNALASVAVANTKAATFLKAIGGQDRRACDLLKSAAEFWGLSGDLVKYGETFAKAAKEVGFSCGYCLCFLLLNISWAILILHTNCFS